MPHPWKQPDLVEGDPGPDSYLAALFICLFVIIWPLPFFASDNGKEGAEEQPWQFTRSCTTRQGVTSCKSQLLFLLLNYPLSEKKNKSQIILKIYCVCIESVLFA